MKFITAIAAVAAVAAVANAQTLQINNPTQGTVWTTGAPSYISWTSNCAAMGNASHAVGIQLVNGPSTAVRFVADLGNLDCSGTNTSLNVVVPSTVVTGEYSLRVNTLPQASYSLPFQINNPSSPAQTTPPASSPTPAAPTGKSAGSSLVAGSMAAVLGCAVALFQLAL
ncbi:hypothetical protein BGZ98_005986 [Dissophora globulifera]|uniref:Yeast cell wall synthesis Kre9/Knh1-like N-terminal domain-containing protein n=1 Tax=Dissophora globulifera TaxID=979702 RepID=A0A9P6UML3_9FUNG|nr:hypothetical protein BGZ98_005986 [Dissophora globulifera]KAG0311794.1 hypothetical protein BGZ99_009893 [Dissophora globulifera]